MMLLLVGAWNEAADIDSEGRITIEIAFDESEYPSSAQEQAFYCAVVQSFNQFLWQATNGQHWIGEVDFTTAVSVVASSDVIWKRSDGRAEANALKIWMYDEERDGFVQSASSLGWILLHEFSHFFYGLRDEYVSYSCPQRESAVAICVNFDYELCADPPQPLPPSSTTCVMAKRYVSDWCDSTNHLEENLDFPGFENPVPDGYTCWNRALSRHADLTHAEGDYPDAGNPPETVTCNFLGAGFVNGAVLVLDRSGSMAYQGVAGIPAIRLASDAALLFYNRTALGEYSGVVGFNENVMDPWPIPYGPFSSEVTELSIEPTGATDIATAIDAAANAIRIQGNNGNRNILLISDGKHNTGARNPVTAALEANEDNIKVHTLAFGDADRDMLRDIAVQVGGTFLVAGARSPNPDEPNPHELKQDIVRSRFKLEGELEVFERIGRIPSGTFQVETFHVPTGTARLDYSWLGDRTFLAVAPCEFSLLGLELESPSGVVFLPAPVDASVDGEYATVAVLGPEPGTWTARVDGEAAFCDLSVAWTGFIRHADLSGEVWVDTPLAPLDHPVVIHAQMYNGSVVTDISAMGTVRHLGNEWTVVMNDDGLGHDARAADGVYTGTFNSSAQAMDPGAYQVKVFLNADAALARPADAVIMPDDGGEMTWAPPAPRTARLLAEGAFRLSSRYVLDAQGRIATGSAEASFSELTPGECYPGLALDVAGLPMVEGRVRVGLGEGVQVDNLQVLDSYPADGGTVTFDACVDQSAPSGPRTVMIQVGDEILRAPFTIIGSTRFLRGDCNDDGDVNIADATCTLDWLFAAVPVPGCQAALNVNGDGKVDIADPVALLSFLFGGGSITPPFPDCGPGALPSDAELGCSNPSACQ